MRKASICCPIPWSKSVTRRTYGSWQTPANCSQSFCLRRDRTGASSEPPDAVSEPGQVGGWPTLTLSNADSPQPGVPRPSSAWVGGETLCQPESLSTPPTSKIPATRSFHKPKICAPDASEFPQPAIIEIVENFKGLPGNTQARPFSVLQENSKNARTHRPTRLRPMPRNQSRSHKQFNNLQNIPVRIRNLPAIPPEAMENQKLTQLRQQNQKLTIHPQPTYFRINIFQHRPLESIF